MHSRGRFIRRIGAALSSILLLQLTLLGSGTLCAMPSDMGAMPGMTHSVVDRPETPPASSHPDDGCRLPWSPGQCATMTACTMAAMPAAPVVVALDARPAVAELPMP
ncbi:MAG TPA: hypothetical protein VFI52_16695, partial [Gemmatimonadaceae bacterium]|nr:hypothetical protein [Gemmatimonadaceae bacterium]